MKTLDPRRPWLWMVVVATMGVGVWVMVPARMARADDSRPNAERLARVEELSETFRDVSKRVRPAVVQIISKAAPKEKASRDQSRRRNELPEDSLDPFQEFFKNLPGREGMPGTPPPRTGSGSGIIIDAEKGLILTNNHVVGDTDEGKSNVELRVKLADGRRGIAARVVGQDPKTDVALIQIDADHLQAATLGDSSKMEVGDWVLAIGAPFGYEQTVTQGIISATGRNVSNTLDYQDWLQTDAAINPGNSGGPLVNMRGEVVGVNVAIATSGMVAGYQGVGFAIPINEVKEILPDLREGREVVRGYLGVLIQGFETQPGIEETYGLKPNTNGVLVEEITPRSPASKAGLRQQDVILGLNGQDVQSASHLRAVVARTKPGKSIDLKVLRDSKEITIPVTIEKQPADMSMVARQSGREDRSPRGNDEESTEEAFESLGMTVEQLTAPLAKRFGLDVDEAKGWVVVTAVEPLGDAAFNGIGPGDLIVSVQGKQIKSTRALRQALTDESLQHGLRMQVKTKSGSLTLFLKVNSAKR